MRKPVRTCARRCHPWPPDPDRGQRISSFQRSGSLGDYGDSKGALNDAFRAEVPGWAERGVISIVLDPGWVRTDMGGTSAPLSVAESARGIRSVVSRHTPTDRGRFLTWRGDEHRW